MCINVLILICIEVRSGDQCLLSDSVAEVK